MIVADDGFGAHEVQQPDSSGRWPDIPSRRESEPPASWHSRERLALILLLDDGELRPCPLDGCGANQSRRARIRSGPETRLQVPPDAHSCRATLAVLDRVNCAGVGRHVFAAGHSGGTPVGGLLERVASTKHHDRRPRRALLGGANTPEPDLRQFNAYPRDVAEAARRTAIASL